MCKKCNNTGVIITNYRDGHEDVDLCDCEYNPYTQLRTVKAENKRLREAIDEIKFEAEFNGNDESVQKMFMIAEQALGE